MELALPPTRLTTRAINYDISRVYFSKINGSRRINKDDELHLAKSRPSWIYTLKFPSWLAGWLVGGGGKSKRREQTEAGPAHPRPAAP